MPYFQNLEQLSRNLTILYVEDDDKVRRRTARIFSKLFKVVNLANDGKEGLEIYRKFYLDNNTFYDIVITDIKMPFMNGIDMSREILKINTEQKVIITSAYNNTKYFIDLINLGVDGFIQKPTNSKQIFEVFHEVCSAFHNENKVELGDGHQYDILNKILFFNEDKVNLADNELKTLDLLVKNKNQSFSSEDIFNHIYYKQPDREFSADSIKSLLKRLRKKLPDSLITNKHSLGYSLNL